MISTLILASSPIIKVVASPTHDHPVSSKWIALSISTIIFMTTNFHLLARYKKLHFYLHYATLLPVLVI